MSDPVSQFVAGLDALAAAPGRRGPLVIYQVDVLAGQHSGQAIQTALQEPYIVQERVTFAHTNAQPSPITGWLRHSRQLTGWGTDPNPAQAWLAHVRGVLALAQ